MAPRKKELSTVANPYFVNVYQPSVASYYVEITRGMEPNERTYMDTFLTFEKSFSTHAAAEKFADSAPVRRALKIANAYPNY